MDLVLLVGGGGIIVLSIFLYRHFFYKSDEVIDGEQEEIEYFNRNILQHQTIETKEDSTNNG